MHVGSDLYFLCLFIQYSFHSICHITGSVHCTSCFYTAGAVYHDTPICLSPHYFYRCPLSPSPPSPVNFIHLASFHAPPPSDFPFHRDTGSLPPSPFPFRSKACSQSYVHFLSRFPFQIFGYLNFCSQFTFFHFHDRSLFQLYPSPPFPFERYVPFHYLFPFYEMCPPPTIFSLSSECDPTPTTFSLSTKCPPPPTIFPYLANVTPPPLPFSLSKKCAPPLSFPYLANVTPPVL
jgi:hypothetical protein